MTDQRLLSVREVAEMLQVAPTFIYPHAAELGAFKLGSHLRFSLQSVEEWLAVQRLQAAPDRDCQYFVDNGSHDQSETKRWR